jgi:hypothetical protein
MLDNLWNSRTISAKCLGLPIIFVQWVFYEISAGMSSILCCFPHTAVLDKGFKIIFSKFHLQFFLQRIDKTINNVYTNLMKQK